MPNLSINRKHPPLNCEKIQNIEKLEYPKRTSKKDIELIKTISKTHGFINDYDKWKLGNKYSSKSKIRLRLK